MENHSGASAQSADVIVVGAGHNGLVAATFLARAGLRVHVVEDKDVIGGATRTEKPFKKAPELGTSTGAYLLGLMPPELIQKLGVDLPVLRRDPHYFLPTTGDRHLLLGGDTAKNRASLESFFSKADADANDAMQEEIGNIRDDIAPTWLEEPLSIEETAEKYVRPALRSIFVDLCRKPVSHYISRFAFKSDLVRAMYAVTDGFSGLFGSWDTPGTGMNFLVHNMCRLPNAGGTWMIVKGGMGTVSGAFADAAKRAGATIETGNGVDKILRDGNAASGVLLKNGKEIRAKTIVVNGDPFRMQTMLGQENLPAEYNKRLDSYRRDGSTMKVNLALKGLPKFKCLPEDRGQFQTTIHLLPEEKDVIQSLRNGFEDVKAGKLAEFPTIEWYIHTTVDKSLQDKAGHHNSALFVQWVPFEVAGSSWEAEEEKYVKHLLSICDRFAPGTSDLVVDTFPLHPKKIESHFGITRGHIHHVDNAFGFSDRLPYATPVAGVYSCSAGCHPAGSVIGAAGHNAAMKVLGDLGTLLAIRDPMTERMTFSKPLLLVLASTALFACKTDEIKDDLGNVEFGSYSFHVEQEGAFAPGTSTNYAIKANPGTQKPDQVSCYYGAAADTTGLTQTSPIVIANYDPGDDDFDCTYMTPNPDPVAGRLFIQVTFNGIVTGGSIDVAK